MKREQVPRLLKAKDRQAAVAASTTDIAASSPAESELTTEFASPDSPPMKLSPEQVRQLQEKISYLKALARGIMAVGGMPMTPSPVEGRTGATSATPASAVGADSDYSEEESPVRQVVLPVVDEDVVDEPKDTGGASSSEPPPGPGSAALTPFHFVPFADELLLNKASQAMLRYFPENLEVT